MLPRSLSSRIYGFAAFVAIAIAALTASLFSVTERTRSGFLWVSHTQEVLHAIDLTLDDLHEAESGQRGFLLTRSPAYLETFGTRVASAETRALRIVELTRDNPEQAPRADRLRSAVAAKIDSLRAPLALARDKRFDAAVAIVASGRGKALMDAVSRRAHEIGAEEQRLLAVRLENTRSLSGWNRDLLLFGAPALALLFAGFVHLLLTSVRKPMRSLLASIHAFGTGDLEARAPVHTGTVEFDRLASAYNDMAERLTGTLERLQHSDEQLQTANSQLREKTEALEIRGRSVELLAGMAHRMQACRTDEELTAVLGSFLPRVLPRLSGALYVHNNSRNMLVRLAAWGDGDFTGDSFTPGDCWGLRRGQAHVVTGAGADVRCAHVSTLTDAYHCEPILAGGEVVGLLHLGRIADDEERFRLAILTENIALSLVNHRLQRGLREQSIRDPLTNLFNRRYMEEALTIETARSARAETNLGVVMCDVDHFKRFNDAFGHEAGDLLLRSVAELIRTHFRDGDIACRYGGEEFAIIAPGVEPDLLIRRTELLRQAVRKLSVQHQGRSLGEISMSFGIACWSAVEDSETGALLRAADAALYRAKREGRDRVVTAEAPPRLAAAE